MDYIALLHKDKKSDYGVSFPDFPGCVTAGKTLEEASRHASEVLSLHIAGMKDDGQKLPEPSTLDYLENRRRADMRDAVPFLVTVSSAKTIRINFTAREYQVAEIDRRAELAGLTRSAYIVLSATGASKDEIRMPKAARSTLSSSHRRLQGGRSGQSPSSSKA